MVSCVSGNGNKRRRMLRGRKDMRNETDSRCEKDFGEEFRKLVLKMRTSNLFLYNLFPTLHFTVSLYWKYCINVYILEDDDAEVNRNGKNITFPSVLCMSLSKERNWYRSSENKRMREREGDNQGNMNHDSILGSSSFALTRRASPYN